MLHMKFAATHAYAMCSSTLAIYMSVYALHVMWWYIYEMCQSFDFYAPLGSTCPPRPKRRRSDLEEELSDPPCSLRSAGKCVRSVVYHL